VVIETDSMFSLYSHVVCAGVFSIVPHSLLGLLEASNELTAIPLIPELNRRIGLIALEHDPLPPIVAAAWATTQSLDLETLFSGFIRGAYRTIGANA
jgi:hypothetical protein